MNEPSVKCRNCGEVIVPCIDGCPSGGYVHCESHYCYPFGPQRHKPADPPIRTVLSAEDRERLDYVMKLARDSGLFLIAGHIKDVLANAGGGK